MANWHVYILRCRDGSLYTGVTQDLNSRMAAHNAGKGAKYTASRRPARIVYHEPAESKGAALKRENQIKHWTKAKKECFINNESPRLRIPSKRYTH